MPGNVFVDYLNTLHNEQAGNENALAESQQDNPMFKRISVKRDVCRYLRNRLCAEEKGPCIIILTGHAGDGKTTLLFQVLESLNIYSAGMCQQKNATVVLPNGHKLSFVKDFSEQEKEERVHIYMKAIERLQQDEYTILVANTGPLIETYCKLNDDHADAEQQMLDAIDESVHYERILYGIPTMVLNIARLDNTSFIIPYAEKLIDEANFTPCDECEKKLLCPIFENAFLLRKCHQAIDMVRDFYIWEQEHDNRATIRQISAHLAYAITGGLNCAQIQHGATDNWRIKYLFSNLLFGYTGAHANRNAMQIRGISRLSASGIDRRKTSLDYRLYICRDTDNLFPNVLQTIVTLLDVQLETSISSEQRRRMLKRMLIVFAVDVDQERKRVYEDVFSRTFPRYLKYRDGTLKPKDRDKQRMFDALSMIFTGEGLKNQNTIYLTLRRGGEQIQNVQMLIGRIDTGDMDLMIKQIPCTASEKPRYALFLQYQEASYMITLPMLDYFEGVAQGMIQTSIDPVLSHGIDNLKAQLLSMSKSLITKNSVELLVQTASGWQKKRLTFEDGKITG